MATDISENPPGALSLETGDNLTREEFLSIWEQLPHINRAELIGGVVYMPSPVSKNHGRMDRRLSTWLGVYLAHTPGCDGGDNTTSLIGEDAVQPDSYLAILPECGGSSRGEKYVEGAPEFIGEISYSSVSLDLHQKLDLYEREGVREYLVVLLKSREIRWHRLTRGKFRLMPSDVAGVYRSRVFPGLWLDGPALLDCDMAKVLAKLDEGIASEEHQRFVVELAARKKRAKS